MIIWTAIKWMWYGGNAIDNAANAIGDGVTNSYLYLAEIPETRKRNKEIKIGQEIKSRHREVMDNMRLKYSN